MNGSSRSIIQAAAGIALLVLTAAAASGQHAYPTKAIHIVVPFSAGTAVDILPRMVGEKLAARMGQPVIVENRPGASGNIGAELVARAEPDGYTLLASPPPPLVINQLLYDKLAFDPAAFVPVTVIAAVPNVLVVNPKVPAATLSEFIAFAQAHPGRLNYASPGNGTTPHLTAEWFMSRAGVEMVHVPYKGGAPALGDLLGGQVDVMFANLGDVMSHVRSGNLRAIAVGSPQRSPALPDVPTLAERFPGLVSVAWYALVAPPRTPAEIAEKLSAEIAAILRLPDVAAGFRDLHAIAVGSSPVESAAFMSEEATRWGAVIKSVRIKAE